MKNAFGHNGRVSSNSFPLARRDWLKLCAAGVLGSTTSGWFSALANETAQLKDRRRSCILLWMSGGPSQIDTFDLKPGHPNGGPIKEIETAVPGIRISEHLPQLAKCASDLAIVRSMSTKEGDHSRATSFAHLGYLPQGPIRYPTFGSLIAKELGDKNAELPNFVSIAPNRGLSPLSYDPGFLGAHLSPLIVGGNAAGAEMDEGNLKVEDLQPSRELAHDVIDSRQKKLQALNGRFLSRYSGPPAQSYQAAYDRAITLMNSQAASAFSLEEEPAAVRDAYGRNRFGQGCLLARRLVERGVPFVEVTLSGAGQQNIGWDTHADNFKGVEQLSGTLDPAWATMITDLKQRGLLDSTLIVWMGEFGRTPKINENTGRDHFPQVWSSVLAGGGIKCGQVIGKSSEDGTTVEDRPVAMPDLLASICMGLGIDPQTQNLSNVGRPIRIVDPAAQPIKELIA